MYDVIIVDDEKLVRKSLIHRINWGGLALNVAAESDNGRDALLVIEKIKPDIVLVDVKMPIMNGIELIRQLRHSHPQIQTIVISGYDDFEYVKEALKLGVNNYIKKPFDEEEMEEALRQTISKIDNMEINDKRTQDLMTRAENSEETLLEKSLNKLLNANNALKSNDIDIKFPYDCFAILLIHASPAIIENMTANRYSLLRLRISMIATNLNMQEITFYIFTCDTLQQEIIVLFNGNGLCEKSLRQISFALLDAAVSISGKPAAETDICLAFSSQCSNISSIPDIYQNAISLLKSKILIGSRVIGGTSTDISPDGNFLSSSYKSLELLKKALDEKNFRKSKSIIEDIFSEHNKEHFSIDLLESIIKEFANVLIKISFQNNLSSSIATFKKMFQPGYLLEFNSLDHLKAMLHDYINDLSSKPSVLQTTNVVESIKKYIELNLHTELSLDKIASEFYINPCYLSQLFKSKTEVNITTFREDVRIEKAKLYLVAGNLNITDIANSIGFNDVSYFCKVFKKKTGISASKFRKNNI